MRTVGLVTEWSITRFVITKPPCGLLSAVEHKTGRHMNRVVVLALCRAHLPTVRNVEKSKSRLSTILAFSFEHCLRAPKTTKPPKVGCRWSCGEVDETVQKTPLTPPLRKTDSDPTYRYNSGVSANIGVSVAEE